MNFNQAITDELWKEYTKTRTTETRDLLVEQYMPYARAITLRFIGRSIPGWRNTMDGDDLVVAAQAALAGTIERYNPGRGVRFLSFATARIMGAIKDECREMDHLSRVHRFKVKQGLEKDVKQISLSQKLCETDSGKDMVLEDFISDNGKGKPDRAILSADGLEELLIGLTSHESTVMRSYYRDGLTMKQIGEQIGCSASRISQLHQHALTRIAYCVQQRRQSAEYPINYNLAPKEVAMYEAADKPMPIADLLDQLKGVSRQFTLNEVRDRLKVTYEEIVLLEALEQILTGGNGKVTPTIARTAVIPRSYTFRTPGKKTNRGRVMDYLLENQTTSPRDMALDMKMPYGSVYDVLTRGKNKYFDNPERGSWNLTEEAREEMMLQKQQAIP